MKNLIAVLAVAAFATPALASENCALRPVVLEHLASKYSESIRSIGLMENGAVLEMFASASTGTWTVVATRPDGVTCLIASGVSFEGFLPPPEGIDG